MIQYPDTTIVTPMSQPAVHAYLKDFGLSLRELETAMAVFRDRGQQASLRFGHEVVRQRHRNQYLHQHVPSLVQEMVRGRDVSTDRTRELVAAALKMAGEMFDSLEPSAAD